MHIIEINDKKKIFTIFRLFLSLFILVDIVGCNNSDLIKNTNNKEMTDNLMNIYNENEKSFEELSTFLESNYTLHDINKNKMSGWKYKNINNYYFYYDYYDIGEEWLPPKNIDSIINTFNNLNVINIHGNYKDNTNDIHSYQIFIKSKETEFYTFCVDDSCESKDDYYEKEKYGKIMYTKTRKINDKWSCTYSNIK